MGATSALKTTPMKIQHLITLAFVLALTTLRANAGFLLPEDSLGKEYWQGLDPKSKIVFLSGYRTAQGPVEDQTAKLDYSLLTTDNFPALVAKLDRFYSSADNKNVFVSAAIRICFMEMSGKPQKDIDGALKQARAAISQY